MKSRSGSKGLCHVLIRRETGTAWNFALEFLYYPGSSAILAPGLTGWKIAISIACVKFTLLPKEAIGENYENLFVPAPKSIIGRPRSKVVLLAIDNGMFDGNAALCHLFLAILDERRDFNPKDECRQAEADCVSQDDGQFISEDTEDRP